MLLLSRAIKGCGVRLLAAVYLLCVLAPAASFAFGDGSHAAHCLTEDELGFQSVHVHHGTEKSHIHADGSSHVHLDGTAHSKHHHGKTSSDGQCCGLFGFSALPASTFEVVPPFLPRSLDQMTRAQRFVDHLPPRLFRPPLSRLPA